MREMLEELEKERALLYRLVVDEYKKDGIRTPSDTVLAQSQKVDMIISIVEKDAFAKRGIAHKRRNER